MSQPIAFRDSNTHYDAPLAAGSALAVVANAAVLTLKGRS